MGTFFEIGPPQLAAPFRFRASGACSPYIKLSCGSSRFLISRPDWHFTLAVLSPPFSSGAYTLPTFSADAFSIKQLAFYALA